MWNVVCIVWIQLALSLAAPVKDSVQISSPSVQNRVSQSAGQGSNQQIVGSVAQSTTQKIIPRTAKREKWAAIMATQKYKDRRLAKQKQRYHPELPLRDILGRPTRDAINKFLKEQRRAGITPREMTQAMQLYALYKGIIPEGSEAYIAAQETARHSSLQPLIDRMNFEEAKISTAPQQGVVQSKRRQLPLKATNISEIDLLDLVKDIKMPDYDTMRSRRAKGWRMSRIFGRLPTRKFKARFNEAGLKVGRTDMEKHLNSLGIQLGVTDVREVEQKTVRKQEALSNQALERAKSKKKQSKEGASSKQGQATPTSTVEQKQQQHQHQQDRTPSPSPPEFHFEPEEGALILHWASQVGL